MDRNFFPDHLREGILHIHLPRGVHHRFGNSGEEFHWELDSLKTLRRIVRDGEFQLGETYSNGQWRVRGGNLQGFLALLRRNFATPDKNSWFIWFNKLRRQWNRISRSYANVAHHYDLDESMFRSFLDRDMHYSCAYFREPDLSLETAQQEKCALIARKLLLKPGMKVLDIGCGWGGLALYLARHFNVEVTGITLSREQLAVAQRRAAEQHLGNVRFLLRDYREHNEPQSYDRIVSVGMFEHVGQLYYERFFQRVGELLKPEGAALLHTIGRFTPGGATNPWIQRYIFPGGYIPALSEVAAALERNRTLITDIEVLRLHYAWTLRHWFERFQQSRAQISARLGERFCRIWEFYLAACEMSFIHADLVVFQLQLAKQHQIVPITRDYLYSAGNPDSAGNSASERYPERKSLRQESAAEKKVRHG